MRPRCLMFNYLQSRIRGTASNGPGAPPDGLVRFYWHFVSQTKRWYGAMFVTSLAVALIDTVIPVFIGKLVSLMEATNRQAAIAREWPILAGMVALVLLVRPLLILLTLPATMLSLGLFLLVINAIVLSLVVTPLIGLGVAQAIGLAGAARQAAVLQTAMPAAVVTTILALEFDTAPSFVTSVVVASTALSPLTLTWLISWLQRT